MPFIFFTLAAGLDVCVYFFWKTTTSEKNTNLIKNKFDYQEVEWIEIHSI